MRDKDGERIKDRYTGKDVPVAMMAILPGMDEGEAIIIEDCIFSLIHYFEEFDIDA